MSERDQDSQTESSRQFWTSTGLADSARLHLQHFLVQRQFPAPLPPGIDVHTPDLVVGDLACGNGIWSVELAPNLSPSAKIFGLDINPDPFPPPEWIPPNVYLRVLDALQPDSIPEEYIGGFDVIYARFLGTIFKLGDPSYFLRTVGKMLKSGGRLRWIENRSVNRNLKVVSLVSGRKTTGIDKVAGVIQGMFKPRDIPPSAFENWEEKYGMKIISNEEHEVPKVLWRPWTEAMMQVAEQYQVRLPLAADARSGDTTREEYQAWLREAFEEVHSGVAMILSPHFELIAQKV